MAAWGCKSFENDLSQDYISTIVNLHIHPLIIEDVESKTEFKKHKLAYYYDRFRAAIQLMILFESNNIYGFAKGYYDLAIEKLIYLMEDQIWLDSWDNESHSKSKNYLGDCNEQLMLLHELKGKARN